MQARAAITGPDFQDPSVDSALAQAQSSSSATEQADHLAYAQKKIVASAPAIFGVSANLTQLVGKSWGHVKYDALMDWDTIRFFFWPKG